MIQDTQKDPRFSDIGNLPSNFWPYDFKQLSIRPFTVAEFKLLSRAAVTKDNTPLLKAVDMVIDQDASQLTQGDFYYALMWLKLHSFPKTPLTVSWTCNASYKGNTCGQANAQLIHQSQIEIVSFDEDKPIELPAGIDYPRASLIPETHNFMSNPDLVYIVPAAQWVKEGRNLDEKIKYLESLPDTELFELALDTNNSIVHGIRETVQLKCSKCGAAFEYRLELEPHNFFRS